LIKDYKFKNFFLLEIEIILLAFIASISCTITILPYALVFVILGLVLTLGNKYKQFRNASNFMNVPLLLMLLIDLPGKYIIKAA
jgi:hypothetical protein